MALYSILFSPTGGTRKSAEALARGLGENWEEIDLSRPHLDFSAFRLEEGDLALVAVPSFGGLAPQPALHRLKAISGNGCRAVLLCVYGNRAYEDTLVQLEDTALAAGFRVVAGAAALAQHSMVRELAAGRPDEEDQNQLKAFGVKIREKLEQGNLSRPVLPGNRPYKERHAGGPPPLPGEGCTRCGLCAARCPTGAIDPADPALVDRDRCIGCLRCVAVCSQGSRRPDQAQLARISAMLEPFRSLRRENQLFL